MSSVEFNIDISGFEKLQKLYENSKKITESFDTLERKIRETKDSVSEIKDNSIVRFLDSLNNRLFIQAKRQKQLEAVGGYFGLIKTKLAETNEILHLMGIESIFSWKGITKLSKTLLRMGGWIAIVAAAGAFIWKAWQENIGGIQSKWIEFTGRIGITLNKFDVQFRQLLRTWDPFIRGVVSKAFAVLEGIFEGILNVITVLKPVFQSLGKLLSGLFGITNKEGKQSLDTWKEIGKWISYIAVGLIGLIAVMSGPIGIIGVLIAAIAKVLDYLGLLDEAITGLKFFGKVIWNALVAPFQTVYEIIKAILNPIDTMKALLNSVLDNPVIKKILEYAGIDISSGKEEVSAKKVNAVESQQVVNNVNSNMNLYFTQPTKTSAQQINKMYNPIAQLNKTY